MVLIIVMLQLIETIALIPAGFVLAILTIQILVLALGRCRSYEKGHNPYLTVLMPAHNEGKHIGKAIDAVLGAGYRGRLDIIVIDDGSEDNTQDVIRPFVKKGLIKSIRTNHAGKSNALNEVLKLANGELVVTIDGDTFVEKGALDELVAPFKDSSVVVSTGTLKAANQKGVLTWFQRIEYCYYAFYKYLCDKIEGMIWALGPLSAFRRKLLIKVGGFNNKLYAEDIDICLRMVSDGGKAVYAPKAMSSTVVPDKFKPFWKQRLRWAKADIQIAKKFSSFYFNKKYKGAGLFALPVMSYWYFHGVLMLILIPLLIGLGYNQYFLANGTVFSAGVAQFFFNWFSVFGIINLFINIVLGSWQLTLLAAMNIIGVAESYFLYIYSVRWLGEKFGPKDIFAFVFMFPYWLINMAAQLIGTGEWFKGEGRNWWKK